MFSDVFLAMTEREIQQSQPKKTAYMACHFSPSGQGLTNLPTQLPAGSLLLLDDSTPIAEHDPRKVTAQLKELIDAHSPNGIILDFQRSYSARARDMVSAILKTANCPVAVSLSHCGEFDCPVLLPPPPVNKPLTAYLRPYLERGVYLEIAREAVAFTVTGNGCYSTTVPTAAHKLPLENAQAFCHYHIQVFPESAVFTLQRTGEDLSALTKQAYLSGVRAVVGLYQELKQFYTE